MQRTRAILVHWLAASLLVVSVCPCSGLTPAGGAFAGGKAPRCGQCGPVRRASASRPLVGASCCCRMLDGQCSCGMACCCAQGKEQPVPPTAPGNQGSANPEQIVLAFADLPALLTACEATALLRRATIAGSGCSAPLTLQSQAVRIQT